MNAKGLFFSLLAMIGLVASATAQNATIPYSCDFESSTELACWRFQNTANNRWTFGHATNNGGTTSMYISNNNGLTNSFTYERKAVAAYRNVALRSGVYSVSYDWKMDGYSWNPNLTTTQFMRVMLVPDATTLPNDSILYLNLRNNVLPTGAIPLDDNNPLVGSSGSWTNFRSNQVLVNATGTYKLLFVWVNYSTSNTPAAVDNIMLDYVSCPQPLNVTATVVGDSIEVDWTSFNNNNPALGWIVEYKSRYSNAPAIEMTTPSKPFIIHRSGLTPNSYYDIRVRTLCDTTDTSDYSATASAAYKMIQPTGRFVYDTLTAPNVLCTYGTYNQYGNYSAAYPGPYANVGVVDSGSWDYVRSRHTVHRNLNEKDSCTGYVMPTIYDGTSIYSSFHHMYHYTASVRLGGVYGHYQAQAISYEIDVDSAAADVMMVNFAFVETSLYTSSTGYIPRLVIDIVDTNNTVLNVVTDVAGFYPLTNYCRATNSYYKDWSRVAVNMTPYHGQKIKLRFATFGCGHCIYFASYAYLIPDFRNASLVSTDYGSKSNTTTFAAPDGYKYKWYLLSDPSTIIDSTQTASIPNGNGFACELTDLFGNVKVLLSFAAPRVPHSDFVCNVRNIDCNSKEIQLINNSYMTVDSLNGRRIDGIEDFYWSFNDGEKVSFINNYTFTTTETGLMKISLITSTANNTVFDTLSQTIDLSYVPSRSDIFDTINYGENYAFAGRTLTHTGVYNDTLTSVYGCDSIVSLHLHVTGDVSIETANLENVKVYPNPVSKSLVIDGAEVVASSVYDGTGKIVLKYGRETAIDVSKLAAGIYTIRVETPFGVATRKFVKQ